MITVTHLDIDDIRSIIAHSFGVEVKEVMIDCYMETIGYGLNEHKEPAVRAVVTTYTNKIRSDEPKNGFEESIANGWIYG